MAEPQWHSIRRGKLDVKDMMITLPQFHHLKALSLLCDMNGQILFYFILYTASIGNLKR